MNMTSKPKSWIAAVLLVLLFSGCASEKLYRQGMLEIEDGRYESGLQLLKQASAYDRTDLQYRTAYERQRENIVNEIGRAHV